MSIKLKLMPEIMPVRMVLAPSVNAPAPQTNCAAPEEPVAVSHAEALALFERAVGEHSRRLLSVARAIVGNRASPEDVVQQALVNLFEHRHRYDWREPGGLMRRAVVNESLRLLRQPRMTVVEDDREGNGGTPVGAMIDRETIDQVRWAIDRLPEHFRAALVLCEYERMDYAQIADVLGASVPQVKTWLHRGRRQLGRMLEEFMSVSTPAQKTAEAASIKIA